MCAFIGATVIAASVPAARAGDDGPVVGSVDVVGSLIAAASDAKDAGACADAVALYERALAWTDAADPRRSPAAYDRAVCLEMLDRVDRAVAAYGEVIDEGGSAAFDARFRRGLVALHRADDGAAAKDFRSLRRVRGADRDVVRLQLAWIDVRAGRLGRAGPVLAALTRTGFCATAGELAEACFFQGELHLATADWWAALASRVPVRTKSATAFIRGFAQRNDRWEQAQTQYALASEGEPLWAMAALLRLGRMHLAIAAALESAAIANDPTLAAWASARVSASRDRALSALQLCQQVREISDRGPFYGPECATELEAIVAGAP